MGTAEAYRTTAKVLNGIKDELMFDRPDPTSKVGEQHLVLAISFIEAAMAHLKLAAIAEES